MWAFMLYGWLFVRRADYQLGSPLAALVPRSRISRARSVPSGGALAPARGCVSSRFRSPSPRRSASPSSSTLLRRRHRRAFDWLLRAYGRERALLHSLFHLIELAEVRGTSLGDALDRTPGLGVSFERRERFLEHAIGAMALRGEAVPLPEVALAQRRLREAAAA